MINLKAVSAQNKWKFSREIKINKFEVAKATFKRKSLFKIDKYFIYSFIPLCLFFTWRCYTLYEPGSEYPISTNMDSMKHVIRAYFLSSTGIESINVNYLHLPQGLDPYHYFEAWTVAAFGTIFNANFWVIEQLVVYPIFSSTIVVGFWGLLQKTSGKWWIYALGIVIPQFTGFYIESLEKVKYLKYSGGFSLNAFDEWKGFTVSVAYLIILLFLNHLFTYKQPLKALLILLILPIVSITLLPGIFSIVFLSILTLVLLAKRWGKSIKIWTLIFPFLIFAAIVLFYHQFESPETIIEKPGVLDNLKKLFTMPRLKLSVIIVIEKVVQGIILFSPYVILLTWFSIAYRKKIYKKIQSSYVAQFLGVFILLAWAVSSFYWMLFYGFFGAGQFYTYTFLPFLNILVFWLVLYSIANYNKFLFKPLGIVIILVAIFFYWNRTNEIYLQSKKNLYDKYSTNYQHQVLDYMQSHNITKGFKIVNPTRFVKYDENDHLVGGFLPGMVQNLNLYSITYSDMYFKNDLPSSQAEIMLPFSGIVVHSEFITHEEKADILESTIQDLITEHNFLCTFVDKGEKLPEYMQDHFKHISTDSISGEQFFVIKEGNFN